MDSIALILYRITLFLKHIEFIYSYEGEPMKGLVQCVAAVLMLLPTQALYASEIYCTIRDSGGNLNCYWQGKEKRVMSAEDVNNFIEDGNVAAYVTLKSRKGMERTFKIDGKSPQYKRLNDMKRSASISEISAAKSGLFSEIEKKLIKLSDELDGQSAAAELILYDQSIALDKIKRENRIMAENVEGANKNREQVCTSTPAFEKMSKANSGLQQTLSDILLAFQTPGTCLADFKIFKDKDGAVDLRQLSSIGEKYKNSCKK